MRIWAVANQKGGVGKTTTTLALAGLLADAGKRVLVVDLDPHGSMTSYFGYDPDSMEHSCYDLFQHSGRIPAGLPQQLLCDTSHEQIKLLPSSTALAVLERQSPGKDGLGLVIARTLALLTAEFDFALIDSPPLLGVLMVNALAACSQVIVPVQTEALALKGLDRMLQTLELVKNSLRQNHLVTVVPTMYDKRTRASLDAYQKLFKKHGSKVWAGMIPVDTKFRDASAVHTPPSLHAPKARGVLAYSQLLQHLLVKTNS